MPRGGKPGNSGGKKGRSGRKSKAEEMGLAALLDKCWTPEMREACVRKLARDCQARNFSQRHEARKLLMAYAYGRPTERRELTGADGGPIEFHDASDEIKRRLARIAATAGSESIPPESDPT